jgi:drug/metabolite transporter (DMT)-like permease
MWLLFALMSPFFWAIVHVLDAHCVERVFDRPWMGVITSALTSLVVVLIIPFAIPFVSWQVPRWEIVLLALLAGAVIQLSQAFYFQALDYSEAGIVAAYWNMTPALLPIASFVVLNKVLGGWRYLGIAILILASVSFCLLDTNFKARWRSFLLMVLASGLQVGALLLEKHVFEEGTFFGFCLPPPAEQC